MKIDVYTKKDAYKYIDKVVSGKFRRLELEFNKLMKEVYLLKEEIQTLLIERRRLKNGD